MNAYSPLLLSTLLLTACGDPVIGKWEGGFRGIPDLEITVEFEKGGDGTAEMEVASANSLYEGEIEWEKVDPLEYEFTERCVRVDRRAADCDTEEDDWKCEMNDDRDRLKCKIRDPDGGYYEDDDGDPIIVRLKARD